jgi:hypothetical protein
MREERHERADPGSADDTDSGRTGDGADRDADANADPTAGHTDRDDGTGDHVDQGDDTGNREIPEEIVSEAERLTRLATDAAVEAEAAVYRDRRAEIVREHDFVPRVREEDDTLVLYPEEWVEEGLVQLDRIEDTDRAVEVSLSGPDHGAEWAAVEADNEAIVAAVAEAHGQVHAANVRAFADFMGNHYLKRVDDATDAEREEFLTEYYPRNAWPTAEQAAVVEESLRLAMESRDGT